MMEIWKFFQKIYFLGWGGRFATPPWLILVPAKVTNFKGYPKSLFKELTVLERR